MKEGIETYSIANLKNFILRWNTFFPIDKWYRKKYSISFNSDQHRKVNLLDILIEYEEDLLFSNMHEEVKKKKEGLEEYKTTGIFLNPRSKYSNLSDEEADDWFNSIDIEELNKNIIKKKEENV